MKTKLLLKINEDYYIIIYLCVCDTHCVYSYGFKSVSYKIEYHHIYYYKKIK